jgi:hypothetical protein
VSRELPDGTVFAAYYVTIADSVTHTAGTRWRP